MMIIIVGLKISVIIFLQRKLKSELAHSQIREASGHSKVSWYKSKNDV
jgi:hypothetical protein